MAASCQLLVDGYNIIGAWASLKTARDRHSLEVARNQLIEILINHSAVQGWVTDVVFDAQHQSQPTRALSHTDLLHVHFTDKSQTADSYIEFLCAEHKRQQRRTRLIVATDDHLIRLMATGSGAEWFSSERLWQDVRRTQAQARFRDRHREPPRPRVGQCLRPEVQAWLNQRRKSP
ncbi:MAG: NYN domain-containing protein [Gloeomargaritaceae cyanobacterium C42_A2020_066]|nr:NYN domain-containing protein [Gloeomargaritaceae cyanobacterium C42_A2020_066]